MKSTVVPDDDDIDATWDDPPSAETKKVPNVPEDPLSSRVTPQTFRTQSPGEVRKDLEIDLSVTSPRSRQPTFTDEVVLEDARKRSARLSDLPPNRLSEASLDRAQLLSLADESTVNVGGDGGALDLIDQQSIPTALPPPMTPNAPASSPGDETDPERDMRDRFSLGDYSGALVVAESILEDQPDNAEALRYAESCRNVLAQMYTARIGPLDRVPFIAVPREQLKWLSIDHRAGFVLSHVDGVSSIEQILDVSGMPVLDTLRILYELTQQRVINFR